MSENIDLYTFSKMSGKLSIRYGELSLKTTPSDFFIEFLTKLDVVGQATLRKWISRIVQLAVERYKAVLLSLHTLNCKFMVQT